MDRIMCTKHWITLCDGPTESDLINVDYDKILNGEDIASWTDVVKIEVTDDLRTGRTNYLYVTVIGYTVSGLRLLYFKVLKNGNVFLSDNVSNSSKTIGNTTIVVKGDKYQGLGLLR